MQTETKPDSGVKPSGNLPVALPASESTAEQQDFVNVSGEQLEFGLRKYAPETQEDLRWYFRWSLGERRMSMAGIAAELDVDNSTVSRVMRGIYPGLKPPAKMMSRVRILRQQESARVHMENQGRVMTPTVRKIWTVCRKAWNDRLIAMIFGPSHVGKSEALKWFREENNHGATIYVDLQSITGVQALYKEFARALLLSTSVPFEKLKARVLEVISKTTLVLVDEYHFITYAYQKGAAKRMVSEIKSIHDRTGCGMVICSTDVARADFENGPEQKLNEQLWRRGTIKLQLPDAVPVCDVREIVKAYGLTMPDGPEKETWLKYRERNRDFAPVSVLEDIARNQGILSLVMTLKDAKLLASKADHELRWENVLAVQKVYADQLERKHA